MDKNEIANADAKANATATATANVNAKYETDAPETKEQAETLLKDYYRSEQRNPENKLPKRPQLVSWKLGEDGIMVVVDGASGRKLEFVTNQDIRDKEQAEIQSEDAEETALDAEAAAETAEAAAVAAEAQAKAARDLANKKPFTHVKKATKEENKKK